MKRGKAQREKLSRAALRRESLTTEEAARLTGYARDHVGLMIRKGFIKANKRGRDWFIDAGSLLDYVSGNPRPGRKRTS
jgi:excisionase family DNA binding protein